MVSGLAPGRLALTEMVGKSTCGSGETGSKRNATAPASAIADGEQRGGDRPADEWRGDFMRSRRPVRRLRYRITARFVLACEAPRQPVEKR